MLISGFRNNNKKVINYAFTLITLNVYNQDNLVICILWIFIHLTYFYYILHIILLNNNKMRRHSLIVEM